MSRCVGSPVSWLALEMYALGDLGKSEASKVQDHLEACSACRECADSIEEAESLVLPPLPPVEQQPPRWPRWQWALVPALAAALLFFWFGRDRQREEQVGQERVKGGSLEMVLIRESGGQLAHAARFADNDRFKVEVSCASGSREFLDVAVFQEGEVFFPIEPVQIECRNNVALPGAFQLTGSAAEICVVRGEKAPPPRADVHRTAASVGPCRTVSPISN